MTEEQRVRLIQEAKDAFKYNIGVRSPTFLLQYARDLAS